MGAEVFVHDVGHGQSIHLKTPNDEWVVIDLGASSSFSPLRWLSQNTSCIDWLIISHPHGDHIDEFPLISNLGFKVRQFSRPKWLNEEDVFKQNQGSYHEKLTAYFEMSNRYNVSINKHERVGNPNVSGIEVKTYWSKGCGVSNINNHSCIVVVKYHGVSVMISGDNESASWNELLEKPNFLNDLRSTEVFLASHHGRLSGYHSEIFSYFSPSLCIVSDGRVQDTDATSRYSNHALGYNVFRSSTGERVKRNCLTTRNDGWIKVGFDTINNSPVWDVCVN